MILQKIVWAVIMFTFSQELHRHTRRARAFSLVFLLFFSLFSVVGLVIVRGKAEGINYSIKSTITYVNPREGTRIWNLTNDDRTVGLFMNTSWQSVGFQNATYPLDTMTNDTDGNKIAVLKLPKTRLHPGENVSFTVEYAVASKPRTIPNISEEQSGTFDEIPSELKKKYTGAEGPWLVNEPTLVGLAHQIALNETKVLTTIKNFVGWIKRNVNYTTHEVPFYPNETLIARKGDCDDQAILLITLSRIVGIPSYLQIGAIYTPEQGLVDETYWDGHVRAVQEKIGWHGWAMVYVPLWGWLPVDLTYVLADLSSDPLNAIRYGAVAWQKTIQYMNFSKLDYVAMSRQTRSFIIENGFFVDLKDEMTETQQNSLVGRLDPMVAFVFGTATVMLLVSSLLIARRWRRHPEKLEVPAPLSS